MPRWVEGGILMAVGHTDLSPQRPETPSFQLAVDVCNQTAERLQRHVLAVSSPNSMLSVKISPTWEQHFSEIQIAHGRGSTPDDIAVVAESHELLLTMFRYCPGLLLNVVPQLEDNLRLADVPAIRELSTKTLGTMFGSRPVAGTLDISKAYPSAWRSWLGRNVDKSVQVRSVWVQAAREILVNHPELRNDIEGESVPSLPWRGVDIWANKQLV